MSDLPVKVFICHSAIGDAAAETLIRALEAGLAPECYCFVDWTELEVGKTWREPLNTWLEHCDAGLLILNHKALSSPFVAYEVSELTRRWRTSNNTFPLIPIHVKHADASSSVGYNSLKTGTLAPWQVDTIDAQAYDPALDADASGTVATIKKLLAQMKSRTPCLPPQLQRVIELLKKVPDATIKGALARADVHVRPLRSIATDDYEQLALTLRSRGLDGARDIIQQLRGDFNDPDNHWKEEHLSELFDLLAQFWVDPHSAATIAEVVAGDPNQRNLALDAARHDTARFYIHRACPKVPMDNEWMVAPVSLIGGEELADDAHLETQIRKTLVGSLGMDDETLQDDLDAFDSQMNPINPVFVTLQLPSLAKERIAHLRTAFKTVTFLFLTRSLTQPAPLVPDDAPIRRLVPKLEAQDEDAFHTGYSRNWTLLKPRPRKTATR